MLSTAKDLWSGCAPTAFALKYSTCGFHLKPMFHFSGDCQTLVYASKNLQIPTVALTKCCTDALKWNVSNDFFFFFFGVINFRVFKASSLIPYSEVTLFVKPLTLACSRNPGSCSGLQQVPSSQKGPRAAQLLSHFSSLQPNLHYSMLMRVSKDGDFLENRYFFYRQPFTIHMKIILL